jgi:hypothetical protein
MSRIGLLGTEVFGAGSPGEERGAKRSYLVAPPLEPRYAASFSREPRVIFGEEAGPYVTWGPIVRETLLGLLARPSPTVEVRLTAFMELCDRLSGYFHENAIHVDREQLLGELDTAFAPRSRAPSTWADVMVGRVARFYLETYRPEPRERLGELVARVRAGYRCRWPVPPAARLTEAEALADCEQRWSERRGAEPDARPGERFEYDAIVRRYRRRRALVLLGHGRRIEHWFSSHCLNYLLVESYQDWPDLRAYARDLALRVASVRFLLFSHPALLEATDAGEEGPDSRQVEGEVSSAATLDAAAAETFQSVARACESQRLLEALREAARVDDVPGAAGLCDLVTL